jgi:hypothetical protein
MTQKEFTQFTGVQVSNNEFWAINEVYNNSEATKEEFCQMWCKLNPTRVKNAKTEKAIKERNLKLIDKTREIRDKIRLQAEKNGWFNIPKLTNSEIVFLLKTHNLIPVSASSMVYDLDNIIKSYK